MASPAILGSQLLGSWHCIFGPGSTSHAEKQEATPRLRAALDGESDSFQQPRRFLRCHGVPRRSRGVGRLYVKTTSQDPRGNGAFEGSQVDRYGPGSKHGIFGGQQLGRATFGSCRFPFGNNARARGYCLAGDHWPAGWQNFCWGPFARELSIKTGRMQQYLACGSCPKVCHESMVFLTTQSILLPLYLFFFIFPFNQVTATLSPLQGFPEGWVAVCLVAI